MLGESFQMCYFPSTGEIFILRYFSQVFNFKFGFFLFTEGEFEKRRLLKIGHHKCTLQQLILRGEIFVYCVERSSLNHVLVETHCILSH